jgi:predicted transcriptional regulator
MTVETKTRTTDAPENDVEELVSFFRALADPSRLKIVGLLAQQPYPVEQLSAIIGLGESTISHHLSRLSEAGLVSARAEGHYSVYSLQPEALSAMARRFLAKERLPELAEGVDRGTFDRKVLATFTGPDGRFTAFPTQEKKYLVLLRHVLQDFKPEVRYSEKKVNEILLRHSDDTARLRRSLVDFGFMQREGGGRDYWVRESASGGAESASGGAESASGGRESSAP